MNKKNKSKDQLSQKKAQQSQDRQEQLLQEKPLYLPRGYSFLGKNIGIKDATLDLGVIHCSTLANIAALFTTNQIVGAPILVGREHLKQSRNKASSIIVNSKNANVYTGKKGVEDCRAICELLKEELGLKQAYQIFPSSTGIIGMPLVLDKFKNGIKGIKEGLGTNPSNFRAFADSILTTDTHAKWSSIKIGPVSLLGVAKGSGMVEPNLATMLVYFLTDAKLTSKELKRMLLEVSDETFNCLTIDGDMSTSDTVVLMANGLANEGLADEVAEKQFKKRFKQGLLKVAQDLTKMLLNDGEGITKVIELQVKGGDNLKNVNAIGKSILNSFLVKTAFYGNDPNWGRIIMAIGKTKIKSLKPDIIDIYLKQGRKNKDKLKLNRSINSSSNNQPVLAKMKQLMSDREIYLEVDLKIGRVSKTFWGNDLSQEAVRLNSEYTT